MGTAKHPMTIRLGSEFRQGMMILDGLCQPFDLTYYNAGIHIRKTPTDTSLLATLTCATSRMLHGLHLATPREGYLEIHIPSDYSTALLEGAPNSGIVGEAYSIPGLGDPPISRAYYNLELWYMNRGTAITPGTTFTITPDNGDWELGRSWMKTGTIAADTGTPFGTVGQYSHILVLGSTEGNNGYYIVDSDPSTYPSYLTIRHGLRGNAETSADLQVIPVVPQYDTVIRILEGPVRFSHEVIHDPQYGDWDPL